jgi:hypothetical protein
MNTGSELRAGIVAKLTQEVRKPSGSKERSGF